MAQLDIFLRSVENQLNGFYEDMKRTSRANEITKARIEGYMLSGIHLGISDRATLEKLVADVHLNVFGLSIEQRRLDKALTYDGDKDWGLCA